MRIHRGRKRARVPCEPLRQIPKEGGARRNGSCCGTVQGIEISAPNRCLAMRSWTWRTAYLLLVFLLPAGESRAAPADGILLTVDQGLSPDEVILSWTGNQPTFEVYRASNPASVTDPSNLQGQTDSRTWTETPPPGDIFFYEIVRKADPPATIILGASDRILLQGTVVGPAGFFAGEVLVESNLITCVAPSCSGQPGAIGATIVTTNGIILPGLVDAHNHGLYNIFDETDWSPLHFYTNHSQWTAETRYGQMVNAKQYLGGENGSPVNYQCEMDKYAEIKALIAGTTSFLLAPGPTNACYASVIRTIDTPQNDLGQDKIQTSVSVPTETSAQSVCNNFASGTTDAYVVHIAEGTDQTALNEFATLSSRAGGCLLSPKTTIVHGTALGTAEFTTMAAHGMRLVWSPRSNMFLYNDTARIDLAIQAGVSTIALAPDWALGGSINLLDELRFADAIDQTKFGDILTPERLFRMVTIDAAKALAVDGFLGSLEVGKRADITVIGGYPGDPYGALLLATPVSVRMVMVDGRVLYGDSQLIGAGPTSPGCETVSVCAAGKFLCIAELSTLNKLDQTYANIRQIIVDALVDYDTNVIPTLPPFSPIAPLTQCP
jgi:5-methylthioadenosine/S-adenosylhomocysteine deaminase